MSFTPPSAASLRLCLTLVELLNLSGTCQNTERCTILTGIQAPHQSCTNPVPLRFSNIALTVPLESSF